MIPLLVGPLASHILSPPSPALSQSDDDYYFDYTAALLQVVCVVVCVLGLSIGKTVINVFTVSKVMLVFFMIIAGFLASSSTDLFSSAQTFFPEGRPPFGSSAARLLVPHGVLLWPAVVLR